MSEQADELEAATRSALNPRAAADVAEGLLRRAQEITASLQQNEELALGHPELGADRFLRGAHEATESAAKELESLVVSEKALQRLRARLRGAGVAREGIRLAGTRDRISEASATEVTGLAPPEPLTLEVASPSHGQVRVSGLARSCPARAAMIRGSAVVATGDNCTLRSVDHYHVRRVEMPLQALLEPGSPARAALLELAGDHSAEGIRRFQGKLRQLTEPHGQGDTQVSLPVRDHPTVVVTGSKIVQQGDGSDLDISACYVIKSSELQAMELLAADLLLVRSFVRAATEPVPGPATRGFLRRALVAAGRAGDVELLRHGIGLRGHDTSVWALFGVDVVKRASAVMVGTGNELDTDMRVHRGRFARSSVSDDLAAVRELFAREAPRPAVPPIARQQGRQAAISSPAARTRPVRYVRTRSSHLKSGADPGRTGQ